MKNGLPHDPDAWRAHLRKAGAHTSRRPRGVEEREVLEAEDRASGELTGPTYHAIEEAKRHAIEDLYFPGPRPGELTSDTPLPPGSDEARGAGCRCPRIDNAYGKGYRRFQSDPDPATFIISGVCPLHGWRIKGLRASL